MRISPLHSTRLKKLDFEEIFHTGRTFTAAELVDRGVIDYVIENRTGEEAVVDFVQRRHSSYSAHKIISNIRKNAYSVPEEELVGTLESWVDSVMRLDRRRLLVLSEAAKKQVLERKSSHEG